MQQIRANISYLFETVSTLNDWARWIGDLSFIESDNELLFAKNKKKFARYSVFLVSGQESMKILSDSDDHKS